jgi:DNA-binding response OmpR family regulator
MSSWRTCDDRDFIVATTAVLESACDVDVTHGGSEGLAKARTSRPDLILLDLIMPDMDGFDVCEELKADQALADVPIIMLTSLPGALGPSGKVGCVSQAEDYLEKPVKPAELLRRVNRLLSRPAQDV